MRAVWVAAIVGLISTSLSACGDAASTDRGATSPDGVEPVSEDAPQAWLDRAVAAKPGCEDASVEPLDHVRAVERTYSTAGGAPLHLDVLSPPASRAAPVVLLFHGGAFRRGDEDWMRGFARRLAGRGYASASVEYRLVGTDEGTFPDAVADARCAVRYVRAHADELGVDGSRLAAIGFSAGGYLAASLATQANADGLDAGCSLDGDPSVDVAVGLFPPLDLRERSAWSAEASSLFEQMLGAAPADAPDLARAASPALAGDRSDAPLLLLSGTNDRIVPLEHVADAERELRARGAPTRLITIDGERHGFGLGREDDPPRATCAVWSLLDRALRPPSPREAS